MLSPKIYTPTNLYTFDLRLLWVGAAFLVVCAALMTSTGGVTRRVRATRGTTRGIVGTTDDARREEPVTESGTFMLMLSTALWLSRGTALLLIFATLPAVFFALQTSVFVVVRDSRPIRGIGRFMDRSTADIKRDADHWSRSMLISEVSESDGECASVDLGSFPSVLGVRRLRGRRRVCTLH